ncbi:hypothetical protein WME77_27075 [Sorangium sp. So ce764]|uniref:hypothetical protein n=1 Tax=Sorangium sp. So ce764 TaxID=3133320 RepID=UPI003F605DC0
MFAALAAALTLVPAPYARGETLTWGQVKARAAARSPSAVEAKHGARAAARAAYLKARAELSRMLGEEP